MSSAADAAGLIAQGVDQLHAGAATDALVTFCRAVQLAPNNPAAHFHLGEALRALRKLENATVAYQAAIALQPNHWAQLRLGNSLLELGRPAEAVTAFEQALQLEPKFREACNNLGSALRSAGRVHEAFQAHERCTELHPDWAIGWFNRGLALQDLQQWAEALRSYDRALALQPDFKESCNNRGMVLMELGQREAALESFERASALAPDYPEALSNRGELAWQFKRFDVAVECFSRLLEIQPERDYLPGNLWYSRLHCCDWHSYSTDIERIVSSAARGGRPVTPFASLALPVSVAEQRQIAAAYVANKHPPIVPPLYRGERYRHALPRIAYLSADFHNHATSYLMAELFELHTRAEFEITAVSFGPERDDAMRRRLRAAIPTFVNVAEQSDQSVAEQLRCWEIDILVDLKGFTEGSRPGILARRPAPVQVSYLGYPGTLGASYLDYLLADRHVIPAADAAHYAEKIVFLPDSYQVNDSRRQIAAHTPTRAELGLPPQGFVFCCFNNSFKITPVVFAVWMRLLQRVPGSVLWLFEDHPAAVRGLTAAARASGVDESRIVFADRQPLDLHLARHRQADLFLDTLPYNAHTTASDALWAGLPLVTCSGDTFAGRVATSLLHALGVPELCTANLLEYEDLAASLAADPQRLRALREKITRRRLTAPLFDTARFCRHLESAYRRMHQRHEAGQAPESFAVVGEP